MFLFPWYPLAESEQKEVRESCHLLGGMKFPLLTPKTPHSESLAMYRGLKAVRKRDALQREIPDVLLHF